MCRADPELRDKALADYKAYVEENYDKKKRRAEASRGREGSMSHPHSPVEGRQPQIPPRLHTSPTMAQTAPVQSTSGTSATDTPRDNQASHQTQMPPAPIGTRFSYAQVVRRGIARQQQQQQPPQSQPQREQSPSVASNSSKARSFKDSRAVRGIRRLLSVSKIRLGLGNSSKSNTGDGAAGHQ